MIRVILNGALGRMGLMMSEAIGADDGFECDGRVPLLAALVMAGFFFFFGSICF